jgi:hypothetical protein
MKRQNTSPQSSLERGDARDIHRQPASEDAPVGPLRDQLLRQPAFLIDIGSVMA